jgi:ribonuclease HIII
MSDFRGYCRALLARARAAGWSIAAEREIPYGRLYTLTSGGPGQATLSCYAGKKGFKHVLGGKEAAALAASLGEARAAPRQAADAGPDPFGLGLPRVGADESGKGDYFGPLVVGAWRMESGDEARLAGLGVTDSKALGNATAQRLAGRLDELGRGAVLALMPREYNPRYSEVGNLNVLLADLHAACIRSLLDEGAASVRAVVVDQFSTRTAYLERALGLPAGCRFATRTRGEADPAVAAASVLARAAFLDGLRVLSGEFGHDLPPGAGAPVISAGRSFVAAFGREALAQVAKVHFATSAKL